MRKLQNVEYFRMYFKDCGEEKVLNATAGDFLPGSGVKFVVLEIPAKAPFYETHIFKTLASLTIDNAEAVRQACEDRGLLVKKISRGVANEKQEILWNEVKLSPLSCNLFPCSGDSKDTSIPSGRYYFFSLYQGKEFKNGIRTISSNSDIVESIAQYVKFQPDASSRLSITQKHGEPFYRVNIRSFSSDRKPVSYYVFAAENFDAVMKYSEVRKVVERC